MAEAFSFGERLRSGTASASRSGEIISSLDRCLSATESFIWNARLKCVKLEHLQKKYIQRLKDDFYDAEDLIDEVKNIRRCYTRFRDLKNAWDTLEALGNKSTDYGLGLYRDNKHLLPAVNQEVRQSCSNPVVSNENIIGREADKDTVVGMLLSTSHSNSETTEHVSVVAIVGMVGVGKTTLAQFVFDDERLVKAFDLKFWADAGLHFTMIAVLCKLLERDYSEPKLDDIKLKEQVRHKLQGKRFLLVLDDLWSDNNPHQLNQLRDFFTGIVGRGSAILVTCRSFRLAQAIAGYNRTLELEHLSPENSWDMFKRFAFSSDQQPDTELLHIGKQITLKCANLPLAIRVVASLLYEEDINKWLCYKSTDLTEIKEVMDMIMPTLIHNYHDLYLPELRRCSEYCSIFPKDYVIEKEVLINLWLALRCSSSEEDDMEYESRCEDFFLTLMGRFFCFKDIEQNELGEVISFKMNDMIHNIARREAGKEFLMLTDANANRLDKKIRHLSISQHASTIDLFSQNYPVSKTLRTIFNLREYAPCSSKHVDRMLSECKFLRFLDLRGVAMETLPDTFDEVPHLRYLDLSDNEILKKLPTSITQLPCLQTLRLRGCKNLEELPENTAKLVKLMTLDIDGCNNLTSMPARMDTMTRLRTLTMFVVGGDDSKQGNRGELRDLKTLKYLRGYLLIKVGKFRRSNILNAIEEGLVKDACLNSLEILCEDGTSNQGDAQETLLESLSPPRCLRRIVIQGYQSTKLPSWASLITNSVPHLVSITISQICGLQHLPMLSQLSVLKFLHLSHMKNLESIEGQAPFEFTSGATESMVFFPSLENLVLECMPKLKGWWRDLTWMETEAGVGCLVDGNGHSMRQLNLLIFSHLCDLSIQHCPNMTYFPPCPHVKQLELRGVNEVFPMQGRLLSPVASASSNSRDPTSGLEKLVVYYNARVFDSLFQKYVLPSVVDIDIKYFYEEETLQVASNGFQRCRSSLRHLSIGGFYKLKNLLGGGIEHLNNLQSLSVKECLALDLEDMPWKSLYTLSSLKLDDIPKLVNLPKGFQYLTALQSLHIKSCKNLKALGECIGSLTSLQSLHIEDCNNLKSLPECLGSLTSLQSIHVDECNNLEALPECLNSLLSRQILHIKNT